MKWKNVIGFEGLYAVSEFGDIKSLSRKVRCGPRILNLKERILKPAPNGQNYLSVVLCENGTKKCVTVHTLVAFAFIGERPDGLFVDHIDNNCRNNHCSNLQYITPRLNSSKDRIREDDIPTGVYKHNSKWQVAKYIEGDYYSLGSYDTIEEADSVYKKADIHYAIEYIKSHTKPIGVSFYSRIGKFSAKFTHKGKFYFIGYFDTKEEALRKIIAKRKEVGAINTERTRKLEKYNLKFNKT